MQLDSVDAALRSIRLEHSLSIAAVITCVGACIAGVWWLRRAPRQGNVVPAGIARLSGCLAFAVVAGSAFLFGVCAGGEIGEPGKVRLVRALGAPVIRALDDYQRASGRYPASLESLVPAYLPSVALHAPESSLLGYPFSYRADSSTYELSASFAGPGMNTCRYRPRSTWRCGGYF